MINDHNDSAVVNGQTEPQDAGQALDENLAQRDAEQKVWQQQHSGEIGAQTVDLKPSAGNPEGGLPENPTGGENNGGSAASATEGDDAVQKKSDLDSATREAVQAASNEETVRAGMEHDEKFLRLAADFENYKRQAGRRENESRERAARNVIEDLLPVLDNFERALDAARTSSDTESLKMGIEFIAQQFRDALKNHGVEAIEAKGKPFDPLLHDALEEVADSGSPAGTVIDEAQRGYSFRGQVLRPARVRVAGQ